MIVTRDERTLTSTTSNGSKENRRSAASHFLDPANDGDFERPVVAPLGPPSISIQPIRSLSTRQSIHYNSAVDLQIDGNQSPNGEPQYHSATITRAIEELQALLNQAVQIAENDVQEDVAPSPSTASKRRPSGVVATKGAKFLKQNAAQPSSLAPPTKDKPQRRLTFSEQPDAQVGPPIPKVRVSAPIGEPEAEPDNGITSTYPNLIDEEPRTAPWAMADYSQGEGEPLDEVNPPVARQRTSSIHGYVSMPQRALTYGRPPSLRLNNQALPGFLEEKDDLQPLMEETLQVPRLGHERHYTQIFGVNSRQASIDYTHPQRTHTQLLDLKGCRHVDVPEAPDDLDVHKTCGHAPVARDWPASRKRFTATVACISTACLGIIIGIYAGEVPAIQYMIADLHHYTILGNVLLYCGLVVPTLFLWPLPLLHGRKPYTVAALALTLCLQIPQGVAVGAYRSPDVQTYRTLLLLSRAVSGFALGFANVNFIATLLDLFGASLQSANPHQEVVDEYDVRRHGGGMGLWLGIWSWCSVGSISIGFMIGAFIIDDLPVTWGFWVSLLVLMVVLLLNIITPEVRRSAFRRTIEEVKGEGGKFSRVARGEVKLHLTAAGPYWWGEEVKAGMELCWLMVKQPGFLVLSVYTAWVYAQFTLVLMVCAPWYSEETIFLTCGSYLEHWFQRTTGFALSKLALARCLSEQVHFWQFHSRRHHGSAVRDPHRRGPTVCRSKSRLCGPPTLPEGPCLPSCYP